MRVFSFTKTEWHLRDEDSTDYYIEYPHIMHEQGQTKHLLVFTGTNVEDIYLYQQQWNAYQETLEEIEEGEELEEPTITHIKENVLPSFQVDADGLVRILSDVPYNGYVSIYGPPITEPEYASRFNTTDGTTNAVVGNISTAARHIASPTSEGNPYSIGDWSPGSIQPATTNSSISYSPTQQFSITNNEDTEMHLTVFDHNGEVLQTSSLVLTENVVYEDGALTMNVSNFEPDAGKFKANISFNIDLSTLLPNGGRFSVEMRHENGPEGTYTKTQNNIFYDTNPATTTINGDVTFEEGTPVNTKHLSGVEYYTLGSTFEIGVDTIDDVNANTRNTNSLRTQAPIGVPTLNIPANNFSNWSNLHTATNSTYFNDSWGITQTGVFVKDLGMQSTATALDSWTTSNSVLSEPPYPILVDTNTTSSTSTIERFHEEQYRCALDGDFDQPNQHGWDSEAFLNSDDVCFINSGMDRRAVDFQQYNPNPGIQPDYSTSQDASVYLIRAFISDGLAYSNARVFISGSYTSLYAKLAKAWDGTASGGTVWMDCLSTYNPSAFNNGNPDGGSGCRADSGSGYIDITFGSQNISNTSNTMYLRVEIAAGQRVNGPFRVVFS